MSTLEVKCPHCGKKLRNINGASSGTGKCECGKKSSLGLCDRCSTFNLLSEFGTCYNCNQATAQSQTTSPTQNTRSRRSNSLSENASVTRALETLSKKIDDLQGYLVSLEVLNKIEKSEFFLGPENKYVYPSLARGLQSLLFDPQKIEGRGEQWVRAWRSIPSGVRNELKSILSKSDELQKQTIARIQQLEDMLDDKLRKIPSVNGTQGLGSFLRRENASPAMEVPLDWTKLAEVFASDNFQVVKSVPELFNKVSNTLRQQRNAESPDENLIRVLEDIDDIFGVWQQRQGIERFPEVGEKYNPICHETDGSMVEPTDPFLSRTVKSISEYGYRLGSVYGPHVILKKALVVVWD